MYLMVVVSSRGFRASQRKYFDQATLEAMIRKGIADYESGKGRRMNVPEP